MARIGIYGGTFNPPHIGHIRAAQYAISALNLDRLMLVPACISPHKAMPENSPTPEQRLEMLRIATDNTDIQVSDIELKRGCASYTFETVAQLKEQYPDDELILFMGTDMFLSFDSWRNPEKITEKAALGVFYRGEKGEKEAILHQKNRLQEQGARVYLVENPITEISSTELRRLITFQCAESFLPAGVDAYIDREGLYAPNCKNLTQSQLEQVVVGLLKPNRVRHVLGCRDTAIELAKRWGTDIADAARAGLLHDITKALTTTRQLTLCDKYGIILDRFSYTNPKTLHALTGSLVAERIFGENEKVVAAIASHTTGKGNMTTLEKIIYVADYMEPNRDFPGVEELRRLAYEDLDKALKLGLMMTIKLLQEQGKEISPESRQALQSLEQVEI